MHEASLWGRQIEDRGSQITFSGLGQDAPLDAKEAWDPDRRKRIVVHRQSAVRRSVIRVDGQGLFKVFFRFRQAFRRAARAVILSLQKKLVGFDVYGLRARSQPYLQGFGDRLADLVPSAAVISCAVTRM